MHGNLSGFAKLLPVIQRYPDAVKIDLGDIFQGEPLSDLLNGSPMIEALNLAKYDFFIPGNHEFELPSPQLAKFFNSFNGQLLGQWQIKKVRTALWKLIKRNGFTLAVIGMTDNGIYRDRKFYPHLKIVPELAAIEKAMQEIRNHPVDAVILARHGGNYLSGMTLGRFLRKYPEIRLVLCAKFVYLAVKCLDLRIKLTGILNSELKLRKLALNVEGESLLLLYNSSRILYASEYLGMVYLGYDLSP